MQIKFKDLAQIETFIKLVEQYTGDVMVHGGTYDRDGESLMGLLSLGCGKWLDLTLTEEDSVDAFEFKKAVKQIGIKTKGV